MSDVNIAISNDVIKGIIQKKLETAVAAALGTQDELLVGLVHRCLSTKVNDEGKQSGYSTYDKYDLIEWMCRDAIRNAAHKAVLLWVEEQKPKLEAEIRKQMAKHTSNMASQFVQSLSDSASKHPWLFQVEITQQKTN